MIGVRVGVLARDAASERLVRHANIPKNSVLVRHGGADGLFQTPHEVHVVDRRVPPRRRKQLLKRSHNLISGHLLGPSSQTAAEKLVVSSRRDVALLARLNLTLVRSARLAAVVGQQLTEKPNLLPQARENKHEHERDSNGGADEAATAGATAARA